MCHVVGGLQLDLPKMMEQKDKAVHGLTSGIAALFKANKVNKMHFSNPQLLDPKLI